MPIQSTRDLLTPRGSTQDLQSLLAFSLLAGGRLTGVSGQPVADTAPAGVTTLYYTPYRHDQIQLWDTILGEWVVVQFSEITLALGTMTGGIGYDIFGYLNTAGALALEKLAWTDASTRATALTRSEGRLVKSGDPTRLYLGTFFSADTTHTIDYGGTGVSQDTPARYLWNMYNRRLRLLEYFDSTTSWSYTTAAWRMANGVGFAGFEWMTGLAAEDVVEGQLVVTASGYGMSGSAMKVGISYDDNTPTQGPYGRAQSAMKVIGGSTVATTVPLVATFAVVPTVGYHWCSWLENGASGATSALFYGREGAAGGYSTSGLTLRLWA